MMIHVNGVDYFYKIQGSGPPLLVLHGFTGDHSTWSDFAEWMQDHYTILSLDLLGHGKTSAPIHCDRYEIKQIANDLATILTELKLEKVHLLGYSMGGRLALTFAILFPEKVISLILESASPGLASQEERDARIYQDEELAQMIEKKGIKPFVDYWQNIPLFSTQKNLPKAIQEKIREQRLQQNSLGLACSLRGMGTGRQPSWWPNLNTLMIPVQLICGGKDPKFFRIAKDMIKVVPNAKMTEVPHAGHAIHVEDLKSFGTIVKEFLLNLEGSLEDDDSMDKQKRI
ncbi:2-succinyl-6-hydroxy-2,4-cyclohexadiene-1-carboxylate synthase [Lederbergia galactosidilytica]|uniref:Putative 2-succinyl-6-hydroxy-2,4-cyclohexadiene-1-carboxylate synthase n=1 Tax=Lederbergia galactosidilytica TaxID=217031 RepID=A0A177ZXQ5_9BACI|nr:2-succinyl-6-hydroxy-2,4-cyclohexadiene-1-carboxylate synthase [Lederbergia galactosidilytica]KRG16114.1 esterase [Virgibacillus soli]MBP1915240.1 2-succinyl-6-hydroxy-2,4-cyclohexadiene-1-carboxylate synthase [Lederbergia galactosidilytica]OAK72652.1 esterase [Lederbergia galactosidilytica]OAK74779.1 esterase [Lederbergia galactosidilytica]